MKNKPTVIENMKPNKIKKEFEKKFVKNVPVVDGFISYSYWTVVADPEDMWQFIEKALDQQKKEITERIKKVIYEPQSTIFSGEKWLRDMWFGLIKDTINRK